MKNKTTTLLFPRARLLERALVRKLRKSAEAWEENISWQTELVGADKSGPTKLRHQSVA